MRIKQLIAAVLLGTLSSSLSAQDINQTMQQAGNALSALIPYVYNDQKFRDPQQQDQIRAQLDQLISAMESQPDLLQQHAVVRQISQSVLVDQLKQARHLFNTGNFATAQYLLGSAPILCSSCHIQDGIRAKAAPSVARDLFANDFSYAEFNYYIRAYDKAEKSYLAYLQQRNVKTSRISGGKTLERLLDITLITDNDLTRSKEKLQQYRAISGLDTDLQQRIAQWISGIDQIAAQPANTSIEQQIQQTFGADFNLKHEFIFEESQRPLALSWRASLQKTILGETDKTANARNLYLIAILQRVLGEQAELSLSNLYLKECVKLAVPDYSHRCFNEFESHLYFYYGGSSGENPPPEAEEELRRLRKYLKKAS